MINESVQLAKKDGLRRGSSETVRKEVRRVLQRAPHILVLPTHKVGKTLRVKGDKAG